MIKVLNQKKEQPKVYRQMCDKCMADLECEYEDTYEGALGARYIKCPQCDNEVLMDEIDGVELTENSIEFPKHFFGPGGVDIPDDQIQEWVRNCLKIAKKENSSGYFVEQSTGNTAVIVLVYEDEYEILVTKDYYFTSIPR